MEKEDDKDDDDDNDMTASEGKARAPHLQQVTRRDDCVQVTIDDIDREWVQRRRRVLA